MIPPDRDNRFSWATVARRSGAQETANIAKMVNSVSCSRRLASSVDKKPSGKNAEVTNR